jgi:hypothetical protein
MQQFAIDFEYLLIILVIGTSCPPFITREATLAAFMIGDAVPTKKV